MKPFWRDRFVSVDVETTGLDRQCDVVTEIAVVTVESGVVADIDAWVVAGAPAARGVAARLAGPQTARPQSAEPDTVWSHVADCLAQARFVVAYNASFDYGFVSRAVAAATGSVWSAPMLDPWLFEAHEDNARSNRLVNACRRRGVDHPHPHQAESDAVASAALFVCQAETGGWGEGQLAHARELQCQWRDVLAAERQRR